MVTVIVIAVDCMAVRSVQTRSGMVLPFVLVVWGALPMTNLLTIGLAVRLGNSPRRPFLLGFLACGSLAVGASVTLFVFKDQWVVDRLITLLVSVWPTTDPETNPRASLLVWATLLHGVGAVLFLASQLMFALSGGVLFCVLRGRDEPYPNVPAHHRRRLLPLLAPLLLVVLPMLAMEGYFRLKVDPTLIRLATGSIAVFDPSFAPEFAVWYEKPQLPPYAWFPALTVVTRVRIDDDSGPDEFGDMSGYLGRFSPTRCLRQVRITLLDGSHVGESVSLVRCLLRPAR
jgi:hypothetical protein